MSRLRCAIYTRKSTEEGLDQQFNSLEAQREACEAYIKSQTHEGWRLVNAHYDDGGISGGTMDRPALRRLLNDIETGRVNVVVVYKVDRLTRSLSDFAKIVEVFDGFGVSFVSVTQQFNTTTSMGRLTLNMLLSFAQFEREVTGERIRDKIAASKRKGMWMGGVVPLGYDAVDRKLIPNEAEAETIRTLFRFYLKHGNVRLVKQEADRLDLRTKARQPGNGQRCGEAAFTRGHIYKLLANPIYIGDVVHKGERFVGEHEALIDRKTWDAVEQRLRHNAVDRHSLSNTQTQSLLMGLFIDENGERLVPTYANKNGRRYRYYISKSLKEKSGDADNGWRLPARAIEEAVIQGIGTWLGDKPRLNDALGLEQFQPGLLKTILSNATRLNNQLAGAGQAELREFLLTTVDHVALHRDRICVVLRAGAVSDMIGEGAIESKDGCNTLRRVRDLRLDLPMQIKRRGIEQKLVIDDGRDSSPAPDLGLMTLVAKARDWFDQLKHGEVRSVRDLAERHGIDPGDVSRILPLALLAPDIVEAIVEGRQPVNLTATCLKRLRDLPLSWAEQRCLLGFA